MKNNSTSSLLLNPFIKIAGWKAFGIGILIVALTVAFGYNFGICFPGALDIKYSPDLSWSMVYIFQAVGLFSTVLVLYIAALIFAKGVRFQDILGTTTLARFPFFLAPPLGLLLNNDLISQILKNPIQIPQFTATDIIFLLISSILMTVIIIWYIILLYNGFKVSTDLKGNKCIGIFIASIILSEVISLALLLPFILPTIKEFYHA